MIKYPVILCFVIFNIVSSQIPSYFVTMSPSDYETLHTRDIFSNVFLPAVFEFQGNSWTDAQIRFKGHSTRYFTKKPYRIRFSETNLFQNIRNLNFNAMYTDKSFIKEKLAWDLFGDMNIIAPCADHGGLTINNKWKGLYLLVERIDRYFLINRGLVPSSMYEADDANYMADLTIKPDSLLKKYYPKVVGDVNDYSDLRSMIETINLTSDSEFHNVVTNLFDMNNLLSWFAGNILTMMGDTYNKNYYLYRDTSRTTQQWIFIPWDYDLSFGHTNDDIFPYPASLLSTGFAYTYPPLSGPSNVLKDRFRNTPTLMELLRQKVEGLLQTVFTEEKMHAKIDSLFSAIKDAVKRDPQKWGTYEDFIEHIEALKYYVTARRNYLQKTFINTPTGQYNIATLRITETGVPYHFVTYDGRQIATMRFSNLSGLDSIRVQVYPDSTPPGISNPIEQRFVKRWLRITPYPHNATFSAKLQWMYEDYKTADREVGTGVQNERLLRTYFYDNGVWKSLPSNINSIGNFVTIDSITHHHCGSGKHFTLQMPETYTQNWFRQPLEFWQRWYDIQFSDPMNGYIIGEQGTLLKTTDGGNHWTKFNVGSNLPFFEIEVVNTNTIFVVGEHGYLMRSTNSGTSWSRVPIETKTDLMSIKFISPQIGWIVGEKGLILHTTDGGSTWEQQNIDTTQDLYHITIFDSTSVLIAGSKGKIYSTSNCGETWEVIPIAFTQNIRKTAKYGTSSVWLVGDSGLVLHSTDRGMNWEKVNIPIPVTLYDIAVIDENKVYVAGENGNIYYSINQGTSWYKQYTATSYDLYGLTFIDSARGCAVGNGGTILTTNSIGTISEMCLVDFTIPDEHRLYQNYPNPFNPTTTIQYEISKPGYVNLKVYNILGQQITTLIHEYLPAGKYEIRWDISYQNNISSGIYFYTLNVKTDEFFSKTKKMIVLK